MPGFLLNRIGWLLLGTGGLTILGGVLVAIGAVLHVTASSSVRVVKLSLRLRPDEHAPAIGRVESASRRMTSARISLPTGPWARVRATAVQPCGWADRRADHVLDRASAVRDIGQGVQRRYDALRPLAYRYRGERQRGEPLRPSGMRTNTSRGRRGTTRCDQFGRSTVRPRVRPLEPARRRRRSAISDASLGSDVSHHESRMSKVTL